MASSNPQHINVIYSTAAGDEVARFVAGRYSVEKPLACSLLNRGFNDSFLVRTANGEKYVVRISGQGRRTRADINSETAFIVHLDQMGVPVAVPVAARDGRLFTSIALPEGPCFVVMFRFLDGRDPRHDDPRDAALQGQTLARIHLAAENFKQAETGSQRTDLTYLLDRPLKTILTLSTLEPRTRDYLLELG
jgi:Ser/Thr protein kinase RdoA (MazF antagonist)